MNGPSSFSVPADSAEHVAQAQAPVRLPLAVTLGDPAGIGPETVSYTHLTLPTIYSV